MRTGGLESQSALSEGLTELWARGAAAARGAGCPQEVKGTLPDSRLQLQRLATFLAAGRRGLTLRAAPASAPSELQTEAGCHLRQVTASLKASKEPDREKKS